LEEQEGKLNLWAILEKWEQQKEEEELIWEKNLALKLLKYEKGVCQQELR